MKQIFILSLFFSIVTYSQKIQILDAETQKPVSGARIILADQLVYTNEDGYAPLGAEAKGFEVSAAGYKTFKANSYQNTISLKPAVIDIQEVKIVDVDIKKLFEDLYKNYHKRYYDQPSLYDITYKAKTFSNNKLYFLIIADAKLWSKSNAYNFRDGLRKNYDDILQMQLNNVKYLKNNGGKVFNGKTNEFSHAEMGDNFFSFEVYRLLATIKTKNTKFSGRLLSDDGEEQLISMRIRTENGINIEGELHYNKADKVITYFEALHQQTGLAPYKRKNMEGKEYEFQFGDVQLIYDFYKKDGKYLPALKKTVSDKFVIRYDDKQEERKSTTETIYHTFSASDKKGLEPRMDFTKSLWENIPVKENRESGILLSREEQAFLNEN